MRAEAAPTPTRSFFLFRKSSQQPKRRRSDQEFLPAALEILETPPSPVRMGLLLLICAFFAVALVWSYIGRIDIIAVAPGKMQPTGRVKVIQPLETSRVVAIKVENGESVHAGDVLVLLDPADAGAEVAAIEANLTSYMAEVLRRRAAIKAVDSDTINATLSLDWPKEIPASIRDRERRVYTADMQQLSSQVAGLQAQETQKKAEQERLTTMIGAQSDLIKTLQQRVEMRSELVKMNAGSKSNLIDATETLQVQKTTLAQQKGQLAESIANMSVIAKDIRRAEDTFVAENAQKLDEAERQVGELSERLNKARARLGQMVLRAPINGVVQASTITTVGQVVTSGQEVMRIVPDREALEIECYLPNRDIGFVKKGDTAVIKIESFPFTRYGTIDATVVKVARDAIPAADAEQQERDATRAGEILTQGGGQKTQDLVFPVTLRPAKTTINVDGVDVPLGAGMSVTAEIRTGNRRILEYVFSPLVKMGSEAMKER